jgi:hypothetical protein
LDQARAAVEGATSNLDVLEVQQVALGQRYRNAVSSTPAASGLQIVVPAQLEYTSLSGDVQRNGLAGAILGLLIALGVAVLLDRRRARRAEDQSHFAPTGDSVRDLEVGRDLEAPSEKW